MKFMNFFSLLTLISPYMDIEICIAKYRQMTLDDIFNNKKTLIVVKTCYLRTKHLN